MILRWNIDTATMQEKLRRIGAAFGDLGDAFAMSLGYPTRAEREMQQRIDRHMTHCAMRRQRRRKGRK